MAFMGIMLLWSVVMVFFAVMALFFVLGLIFLVCGLTMKKRGLTVAGGVFAALFLLMALLCLGPALL